MGDISLSAQVSRLKKPTLSEAQANSIAVELNGSLPIALVPVGSWVFAQPGVIEDLALWRDQARDNFFARFESTPAKTKSYLENFAISDQSRLLFLIFLDKNVVGHVGFAGLKGGEGELDNVMKSPTINAPGLMFEACRALIQWGFDYLDFKSIHLRVTSTNDRAQSLYSRLGFEVEGEFALRTERAGDVTTHVPCAAEESNVPFRLVKMRLGLNRWRAKGPSAPQGT